MLTSPWWTDWLTPFLHSLVLDLMETLSFHEAILPAACPDAICLLNVILSNGMRVLRTLPGCPTWTDFLQASGQYIYRLCLEVGHLLQVAVTLFNIGF